MEKIPVKICVGTTCFVMGAAHFQSLMEDLPEHLQGRVEIEECRCLGCCREEGAEGRGPFVVVGETVMAGATLPALIARIEKIAAGEEGPDAL